MKLKPFHRYFFLYFFALLQAILFSFSSFSQTPTNNQTRVPPLGDRLSNNPELKQFFHPIPSLSTVNPSTVNQTTTGCNTWTFQLKLGDAGSVEKVNDIVQLPTGDYILVGTYANGSAENGLIVKMDKEGNVIWSRILERATYDVSIKKIKLFSDNVLYALMEMKPIATTITTPVLCAIDQDGNLFWSDQLNVTGIGGSWKGIDMGEWDNNTFSVVINNDSLFNVTKFSTLTRATIWSKTYKSRGNLNIVGIGNAYAMTFVAYNETDSGFKRAVLLELDINNGNVRNGVRIGGIDGTDYVFQSMRNDDLRPKLTGYSHRNGNYELLKFNYNYNISTGTEVYTLNGLTISNQILTKQDDWTERLAVSNTTSPNDIHLISTFPNNYQSPISADKISYGYPVELRNIIFSNDGGRLLASNSLDPHADIVITKVDSIGTLPGCTSVPEPASHVSKNITGYLPSVPQLGNVVALSPISISSQSIILPFALECKSNYCPDVKEPDSCEHTFFKEYRNAGFCMLFSQTLKGSPDKIMVMGRGRVNPYYAGDDESYVTLFDTAGKIFDSRLLRGSLPLDLNEVILLKDGNFLAVGTVVYGFNSLELFAFKFDAQFNIIWSKRMKPNLLLGGIQRVIESAEGDLYCFVTGTYGTVGQKKYLLKLSAAGTPLWFNSYDGGPDNFLGDTFSQLNMLELGSHIYLEYREEEWSDWGPRILKINKSDGAVVWAKKISIPNSVNWDVINFSTDQQNLYLFSRNSPLHTLIKLSLDGNVLLSKKIGNSTLSLSSATQKSATRFLLGVNQFTFPNVTYGAVEIDTGFNTLRDQFVRIPKPGGNAAMISFNDSVAYGIGTFFYDNDYYNSAFLQKFNFNTSAGSCEVTNLPLNLVDYPLVSTTHTNNAQSVALPLVNPLTVRMDPYNMGYAGYFCGKTDCTLLDLNGPSTICDSVNVYDFRITKNQDCHAPTVWAMDTTLRQIKIISITDSLLRIKVISNGNFKIKSRIFANCDWIEDSLTVGASISAMSLNLGPDSVICPGNTVLLNARSGFTSYQWQDGSTDSVYLATQPGTYFVEVGSACNGASFRDTVFISPHPPIPLSIGPDRSKCNNDTLHLSAPNDFLNYTWYPNYNISSTTNANVVINPSVDTIYYLKAEKKPGCFAFDTVVIKVNYSAPIDLGNDKSFCQDDSAVFDAGTGFSNYVWNTGNTSQFQIAKAAGSYSVLASTVDGCKSSDTVRVLSIYQNPIVTLDKNPSICEGTTKVFDAGAGFSSYIWDDGSSGRLRSVQSAGTFFVSVMDQHGCKGSDTTSIQIVYPTPRSFLFQDTAICSYGKLDLVPVGTYSRYLWSNNSNSKTITINKPGTYWLQVADQYNCEGKDTVVVKQKDCMSGFYVPNAFTPKMNSHNDDFKPLLFGDVKKYEFSIYNRWGQMVFHTTELYKGWNGQFAGKDADHGTYVWMCVYQFDGEKQRMEKGTVTLIR